MARIVASQSPPLSMCAPAHQRLDACLPACLHGGVAKADAPVTQSAGERLAQGAELTFGEHLEANSNGGAEATTCTAAVESTSCPLSTVNNGGTDLAGTAKVGVVWCST